MAAETFAQASRRPVDNRPSDPPATEWIRNGISIGRPKVFDNRTLTLMLEGLSDTLRSLQLIDPKTVAGALGNFQGSRVTDTSFALSVTGPSLPGVTNENSLSMSPGQVTTKAADGSSVTRNDPSATSQTTSEKTTTTQAAVTPAAPALPNPVTDFGVNVPYGPNAGDLLTDQVNLTYEIFNLRMILERSLSDRIWNGEPRRQAVLGFNISVDPPGYAADSAAVVEITVEGPPTATGDLALVAMMPQEKTYNATALNSKSNAFAGAAVAKVVNVGMAARKTQKVMYLYRDNDTISFESMPRNELGAGALQFGWVFRPVLGRRSVSPGMRQMFAVISLPEDESQQKPERDVLLKLKVRTYWKKFKPGHMTSYTQSQIFGKDVLRNIFWMSPELKSPYLNHTEYTNVIVRRAELDQNSLRPAVDFVDWTYTGARSVLVTLHGRNFFSGTSIVMGGKTYKDSASGLLIKSDSQIDILTDVDSLIRSDGVIVGRYGNAEAIVGKQAPSTTSPPSPSAGSIPNPGIEISDVDVGPAIGGFRQIVVSATVASCQSLPLNPKSPTPRMPFLLLDDTLVSDRGTITCTGKKTGTPGTPPPRDGIELSLSVPDSLINGKAPILRVLYPFYPANWSSSVPILHPDIAFELERISSESDAFLLKAKASPDFSLTLKPAAGHAKNPDHDCWTLLVGPSKSMSLPGGECQHFDPKVRRITPKSILISALPQGAAFKDRFVLLSPTGYPYELAVPSSKPEPKKPVFVKDPIPAIRQYDARWVDLAGDGLQAVTSAKVNGRSVETRVVPAKKPGEKDKLQVNITRSISKRPGDMDITLYDGNAKVIDSVRLRVVCTACKVGK